MASLALMVMLLLLVTFLIGPLAYGLACLQVVPRIFVILASVASIAWGFWWLMLPVWPTAFLGLIPIILGLWALDKRLGWSDKHEGQDEEHDRFQGPRRD